MRARAQQKKIGFYVAKSPHGDQRVGLCTKPLFRADCPAAAGWTSAEDQTYDAALEGQPFRLEVRPEITTSRAKRCSSLQRRRGKRGSSSSRS